MNHSKRLQYHQRKVILNALVGREIQDVVLNQRSNFFGRQARVRFDEIEQALHTKLLVGFVVDFSDTIGVEQQNVMGFNLD